MKTFTVVAIAAGLLAPFVAAQNPLADLPGCAVSCAVGGLANTGCDIQNIACVCSNDKFVASLIPCVQAGCSVEDRAKTLQVAEKLCLGAGVTLSVPSGFVSTSPPQSSATNVPSPTTGRPSSSASVTTSRPAGTTVDSPSASSSAPTSTSTGPAVRNSASLGGLGAVVAFAAVML